MKNERIYIRLTKAEKQQVERMAASYGWDVSTYLRTMSRWVEETQPRLIVTPMDNSDGENVSDNTPRPGQR